MKILFYQPCSLLVPHMGVVLNKMIAERRKGNEVLFAYCNNAISTCTMNVHGNIGMCMLCKKMHRHIRNEYLKPEGIKTVAISKSDLDQSQQIFEYRTLKELRDVQYKNVNIGLSIVSSYVSVTRNIDEDLTDDVKRHIDILMNELVNLTDFAYDFIKREKPDRISVFNGRFYDNRFFYDIAITEGIEFESVEVVGGNGKPFVPITYKGADPNDIHMKTKLIKKLWDNSTESIDEKKKIAESFFEKKMKGDVTNDKVYTSSQKAGLLPDNIDYSKRNIVIFNSSEDEFFALGGDWDKDKLFDSQLDGIDFLVKNAPDDVHFYLRIHPNLKGLKYDYVTKLASYDAYDNMTVIQPESPVSSYALLNIAEKVVVFGSTIGLEACYWGKPVILCRKTHYYYLDVAYIPKSKAELLAMLSMDLEPKEKDNALKYAYYCLRKSVMADSSPVIDINYKTRTFLGRTEVLCLDYLKLFGSSFLYSRVWGICMRHVFKHIKDRNRLPGRMLRHDIKDL